MPRPWLLLPALAALCACRDANTALSLSLRLQGPAACVRLSATGEPGQVLTTDIPVEASADFRTRVLTAALYPGGALGQGGVEVRAQGFAGACGTSPSQEAQRTVRFVEGAVTPVELQLLLLDKDGDGDGSPDGQDCAPTDAERFPRPGSESGRECGNGTDDDCDGSADDGCTCAVSRPCYPDGHGGKAGVGACLRGTQPCTAATYGPCEGYVLPTEDVCDGVDNDCDGTVDNGCACEEGAERACYEAGPPALAGQGACARGTQRCGPEGWGECEGDVAPAPETCNGADDDCDGATDDVPDAPTPACALQFGVCSGSRQACGQQACTDVEYAASAAALDASYFPDEGPAHCDGLDNDCDGTPDEGCPCATGATEPCHPLGLSFGGLGKGNCRTGTRACQADGGWGECAGAVSPAPESCNGLDDDCDGMDDNDPADAGQPCASGSKGVCAAGSWLCSGGGLLCVPDTVPVTEQCDGRDDDCDGESDEDFPGLGQTCAPGLGACARTGVLQCQEDGGYGCSVEAGLPAPEACNTVDDDCDGQVDEDFPNLGQPCSNGKAGACAAGGTWACLAGGGYGCTAPDLQPNPESCNGADDDCDALTDEGFNLGQPCSAGVGACASSGSVACRADGTSGCNAPVIPPGVESCNGADDDCDGAVDNGFNLGQPCTVGVGACARTGTWACNGSGGATCYAPGGVPVTPGPAAREVCDGADNDCDGAADEQPACGGPRTDVAEDAANTWGFSDSNSDSPVYCSGPQRGRGNMASGVAAENITTGPTSARVTYTYTAYFQARYPGTNNANWDLSTTTGLHFNVKHLALPAGVTWQFNGPLVVLCGAPGSYRVLTPTSQRLSTVFQALDVPLAGQAGAWSVADAGAFSLGQVNSVEFHANPAGNAGGAAIYVYYDDVRFY